MRDRSEYLNLAANQEFDLLIIGGGITGAGIAQNAASRGLSVLLVEKNDFASGTSSKTTKLIHGGLRYLEQFHFHLTRELCQERERLKKLAPHLVKDFSFILPFLKNNTFFNIKASLGIGLYDILTMTAGRTSSHSYLSKKKLLSAAPALSGKDVRGGIKFHDAITDDTRMVLTVLKSACHSGAIVLNYTEAIGFSNDERNSQNNNIKAKICSAKLRDRISGNIFSASFKKCVNATGVWTENITNLPINEKPHTTDSSTSTNSHETKITPSKGTHIIVPASSFEINTALFLATKDNRYVFVVPWQHAIMIGTTDNEYKGNIEKPKATNDEIDYLLNTVNSYTDTQKLNRSDVKATFAGLRPLISINNEMSDSGTSSMSREHIIFESSSGLLNIAGGKLTSYRLMAEELLNKLGEKHAHFLAKESNTETTMLGGWKDQEDYLLKSSEIETKAKKQGIDPASISHLVANYGSEAENVVDLIEKYPVLKERICPNFPPLMAEVAYSVISEMAISLQDVLLRRTRLGILDKNECLMQAPKVAKTIQKLLNWDDTRVSLELEALEEELQEANC